MSNPELLDAIVKQVTSDRAKGVVSGPALVALLREAENRKFRLEHDEAGGKHLFRIESPEGLGHFWEMKEVKLS